MCLWNIWIDVKLLHSRGQERHGKSPANEDTYHRRWYQTWPVWRTCIVVITCCSGFASIQFLVSGDGKRLHPRTSKSFLQFSALLLQSVKMGTIWLSLKGSVNFQLISSSSSLAMVALSYFLGSFHRPIPVRYNWNAFARKMHSTSKFAMIVLSTSVCVCVNRCLHGNAIFHTWALYNSHCAGDGQDIWGSLQRSSSHDPRISPGTPVGVPATHFELFHCFSTWAVFLPLAASSGLAWEELGELHSISLIFSSGTRGDRSC